MTPIYTFGENETYNTFTALLEWRLWLNKFSIPGVFFYGELLCPLFPRKRSRCLSYVGMPLKLPRIKEPSAAQVEDWHGRYVQALRTLFDKNKAEAGKPGAKLEIWWQSFAGVYLAYIYIFVYKYVVCVSVSSMEYLLDIYNNDISDIMIPMMYSM